MQLLKVKHIFSVHSDQKYFKCTFPSACRDTFSWIWVDLEGPFPSIMRNINDFSVLSSIFLENNWLILAVCCFQENRISFAKRCFITGVCMLLGHNTWVFPWSLLCWSCWSTVLRNGLEKTDTFPPQDCCGLIPGTLGDELDPRVKLEIALHVGSVYSLRQHYWAVWSPVEEPGRRSWDQHRPGLFSQRQLSRTSRSFPAPPAPFLPSSVSTVPTRPVLRGPVLSWTLWLFILILARNLSQMLKVQRNPGPPPPPLVSPCPRPVFPPLLLTLPLFSLQTGSSLFHASKQMGKWTRLPTQTLFCFCLPPGCRIMRVLFTEATESCWNAEFQQDNTIAGVYRAAN